MIIWQTEDDLHIDAGIIIRFSFQLVFLCVNILVRSELSILRGSRKIYLAPFGWSYSLQWLSCWKMQYQSNSLWLHVVKSEGSMTRLNLPKPLYGPSPFSFTALKGSRFNLYLLLLQLVLCRVVVLKVSPYFIHSENYIIFSVLWDQRGYFEIPDDYLRIILVFVSTILFKDAKLQ